MTSKLEIFLFNILNGYWLNETSLINQLAEISLIWEIRSNYMEMRLRYQQGAFHKNLINVSVLLTMQRVI